MAKGIECIWTQQRRGTGCGVGDGHRGQGVRCELTCGVGIHPLAHGAYGPGTGHEVECDEVVCGGVRSDRE